MSIIKIFSKEKKINEPIKRHRNTIQHDHSGMTGCWKTHYLVKMLEEDYANHFDYIFLICPTYDWNKTYQNWIYKDDDVEDFLKYIVDNFSGTNSLIVLDDCASCQSVKNRKSELVKLAFSARHYNLSTIVITQQLTSIAKPYRENISKLVTFYNPNKKDIQTIMDEFLNAFTIEEGTKIIENLKNNKYARLEILLRHPYTHSIICPT